MSLVADLTADVEDAPVQKKATNKEDGGSADGADGADLTADVEDAPVQETTNNTEDGGDNDREITADETTVVGVAMAGEAEAKTTSDLINQMVTSSPTSQARHAHRCEGYRSRLGSFTPASYFAKPIAISPIMCAASGWEILPDKEPINSESVLLSCQSCDAVVAVLIPPNLSAIATMGLTKHYQRQLCLGHAEHCKQRKNAEVLSLPTSGGVPTPVARMLPYNKSLELLEQRAPWPLMRQRFAFLYPKILALEQQVQIPSELSYYQPSNEDSVSIETLLTRLLQLLRNGTEDGDNPTLPSIQTASENETAKSTLTIILTGWDCKEDEHQQSALECIFCLSCHRLERADAEITGEEDAPPQAKRRKTITSTPTKWREPLSAHRYYCPWVCGFPSADAESCSPPLWQTLTDRLLAKTTQQDWLQVHRLLQAGVSSRRLKSLSPST